VAQQLGGWKVQHIANSMWACGKLVVLDIAFCDRVAAAAPRWLPTARALELLQVAFACRALQFRQLQFMAAVVKRSKQLPQGSDKLRRKTANVALAAVVAHAVASLDMQELAGDARALVTSSGVKANSVLPSIDAGMLWDVHAWLVQQQLLDGQGLAGLLSEQQLADGGAIAEAFRVQEQRQQLLQQPAEQQQQQQQQQTTP
jgi:hypothetical protein